MVIKSDGRYGVFIEGAISDGLDERGFACILQSDNGYFEFFAEELALDPVEYFINKSHHLIRLYQLANQQPHKLLLPSTNKI